MLTEGGREMAVPTATASKSESCDKSKKRSRRRRPDTVLVFDAAQKVPDHVLKSIIDEWLVPCLVEEFLSETRCDSERRHLAVPL